MRSLFRSPTCMFLKLPIYRDLINMDSKSLRLCTLPLCLAVCFSCNAADCISEAYPLPPPHPLLSSQAQPTVQCTRTLVQCTCLPIPPAQFKPIGKCHLKSERERATVRDFKKHFTNGASCTSKLDRSNCCVHMWWALFRHKQVANK